MSLELAFQLAREARLYPGVILHGLDQQGRARAAVDLARTLLCERASQSRPCSRESKGEDVESLCKHCARISLPDEPGFHPDFQYLERDLKTSTSVDAVKGALRSIQFSPFEARGQVLVVGSAESLSPSAANALLKSLEEPPTSAPRHFFLLTPASTDLLETLRSRCLALYLGSAVDLEDDGHVLEQARERFEQALSSWRSEGHGVFLHAAASALLSVDDFSDPRALRPWSRAARVVVDAAYGADARSPAEQTAGAAASGSDQRRALLTLAHDLLEAPEIRMRSISPPRIIEGLVAKSLGSL